MKLSAKERSRKGLSCCCSFCQQSDSSSRLGLHGFGNCCRVTVALPEDVGSSHLHTCGLLTHGSSQLQRRMESARCTFSDVCRKGFPAAKPNKVISCRFPWGGNALRRCWDVLHPLRGGWEEFLQMEKHLYPNLPWEWNKVSVKTASILSQPFDTQRKWKCIFGVCLNPGWAETLAAYALVPTAFTGGRGTSAGRKKANLNEPKCSCTLFYWVRVFSERLYNT